MKGFQKMTSKTLRGGVARQITLDVHVQSPSLLNIDHNSSLMLINHFFFASEQTPYEITITQRHEKPLTLG